MERYQCIIRVLILVGIFGPFLFVYAEEDCCPPKEIWLGLARQFLEEKCPNKNCCLGKDEWMAWSQQVNLICSSICAGTGGREGEEGDKEKRFGFGGWNPRG